MMTGTRMTAAQIAETYSEYTYVDAIDGHYDVLGGGGSIDSLASIAEEAEVVSDSLMGWGYDHCLRVRIGDRHCTIFARLK